MCRGNHEGQAVDEHLSKLDALHERGWQASFEALAQASRYPGGSLAWRYWMDRHHGLQLARDFIFDEFLRLSWRQAIRGM